MNKPPIPSDVRRTVLRRAKGSCEDYGSRGLLELHHLTLEREKNQYTPHLQPSPDQGLAANVSVLKQITDYASS
jgi:hypothetical protein